MTSMDIQKFYPTHRSLKNLIKYYWVFDCHHPIALDHKILPTNNIDIIFNFKAPMISEIDGVIVTPPGNIYFAGIRGSHAVMKQSGMVQTIGVSFFPAGLYPFFGIPVSEFKNEVIGLDSLVNRLARVLEDQLNAIDRVADRIPVLEQFFLDLLDRRACVPDDTHRLLNQFYFANMGVSAFCKQHGIHPRKLERLFNKYVGTSPKQFLGLTRFQQIVGKLVNQPQSDLTALALDFDYFDQAHFIKDFKAFTGRAPSKFLSEKQSLKQIMKIV